MNATVPDRHNVTVETRNGRVARLLIDEHDITNDTDRFQLTVAAQEGARIDIGLLGIKLDNLAIADARVTLLPETEAFLKALGWTPPGHTPEATNCTATTTGFRTDRTLACVLDPWHGGDHEATDGTQWSALARP